MPFSAITVGGIAIVSITGIILSLFLILELILKKVSLYRLKALLFLVPAPFILFFSEVARESISVALAFYTPFISNILLFFLLVVSSSKLNLEKALGVLCYSTLILLVLIISPLAEMNDEGRRTALGLNQNFSALYLSTSFIYFFIGMQDARGKAYSILYGIIAVSCFAGVIATGTRFGFLICTGFLFWVIFSALTRANIAFSVRLGFLLIGLSTVFVLLSLSDNLLLFTRFLAIEQEIAPDAEAGRLFLWGMAIASVGENIWLGIGPTNYGSIITPLMGSYMSPHNLFFEFYIYAGVLGIILSIPYAFYPMHLFRRSFSFVKPPNLSAGVSVIVIFIILFHHILFNKFFWFMMAWIVKTLDIVRYPK